MLMKYLQTLDQRSAGQQPIVTWHVVEKMNIPVKPWMLQLNNCMKAKHHVYVKSTHVIRYTNLVSIHWWNRITESRWGNWRNCRIFRSLQNILHQLLLFNILDNKWLPVAIHSSGHSLMQLLVLVLLWFLPVMHQDIYYLYNVKFISIFVGRPFTIIGFPLNVLTSSRKYR